MVYSDQSIDGAGDGSSSGQAFVFPDVGEPFEWPGPELLPIVDDHPFQCQHVEADATVRSLNEEGLHGHLWCLSGEDEFAGSIRWWRSKGYADWLVAECEPTGLVFDHGRTRAKCRMKRGTVVFVGDTAGTVGYLTSRWPCDAGPVPAWETNEHLFPPRRRIHRPMGSVEQEMARARSRLAQRLTNFEIEWVEVDD
jgi:hypothetical protein